jgi:type II secretory pathway component PulF
MQGLEGLAYAIYNDTISEFSISYMQTFSSFIKTFFLVVIAVVVFGSILVYRKRTSAQSQHIKLLRIGISFALFICFITLLLNSYVIPNLHEIYLGEKRMTSS